MNSVLEGYAAGWPKPGAIRNPTVSEPRIIQDPVPSQHICAACGKTFTEERHITFHLGTQRYCKECKGVMQC